MPKPATGEFRKLVDGFEACITIQGRERKAFQLASTNEDEGRKRCVLMADLARKLRRAGHVEDAARFLEMAAQAETPDGLNKIVGAVDARLMTCARSGNRARLSTITRVGSR